MSETSPEPGMERREVVLPDGRLLWFYTFDADEDVVEDGKPA